jgi:6-phosphogluconolactonase
MKTEVKVVTDVSALAQEAAQRLATLAEEAVQARGVFTLALSGGSTPRALYSVLADDPAFRTRLPWNSIHYFWGDERFVPPDHPDSNFGMTSEVLLSSVPVPPQNIHRVHTELGDPEKTAEDYESELRKFFSTPEGQFPRFDLILLGLGPDGHTASLFPDSPALNEQTRWVVANWVEKFLSYRITMTLPVLNNGAMVMFLVAGEEKAEVVKAVLGGASDKSFPAQLVRPSNGELVWLIDKAAASLLPEVHE